MVTGGHEDARRMAALDRYQVLDQPPRQDLVALAEVAAQLAEVPMATINLITDTEQHQVATYGFDPAICRREDSMCNAVIAASDPVLVPDASRDERFAANPFVTGEIGSVRFYASHQLRTPSGVVIGTLCVFDVVPHTLSPEREHALDSLAARVVDLLELEVRTRDLRQTVADLERARAELRRSNEQLAAFAGQVSHDLRNPLSAVSMSLELMADQVTESSSADELRWMVDRATRAAARMRRMIDDLLSFAVVGGALDCREVDLARIVEEVREDLGPALAGVALEVGELPTVPGDEVQLRAVVQNLLANAAKFVPPGESARIEVSAARREGRWRVEVADHGLGVPADKRETIFDPFARAHPQVAGSGIGLATVRRIIDAHHGQVGVEETPGGGATFWFELPVPDEAG